MIEFEPIGEALQEEKQAAKNPGGENGDLQIAETGAQK